MTRSPHRLATLLAILTVACSSQPMADDSGGRASPASLDTAFRIAFGETVPIEEAGVDVTFEDIVDSRCPLGVECVWEGSAHVVLGLSSDSGESTRIALDTHPDLGPEREALGLVFRLTDVTPFPVIDEPRPRDAYVATLVVSAP